MKTHQRRIGENEVTLVNFCSDRLV